MQKERILALTIADLGFNPQTRNDWVCPTLQHKHPDLDCFGRERRKLCKEWAQKLTVRDLIEVFDAHMREEVERRRRLPRFVKNLVDKLVELGLTQLDWTFLPNATVTTERLQRLGKQKVRQLPVVVLGTTSRRALEALLDHLGKPFWDKSQRSSITVQDLLNIPISGMGGKQWSTSGLWKSFHTSVMKTRQRLRELGFRYEDGIFLQDCTKRQLMEDLMSQEGLSRKVAERVAEIAEKRHWVSSFVE